MVKKKLFEDLMEGLFGPKNNPYSVEDIIREINPELIRERKRPGTYSRKEVFQICFEEGVKRGDKEAMSKASAEYAVFVRELNDRGLYLAHAKAAVLGGKFALAFGSLARIDETPMRRELQGILAANIGEYGVAVRLLDRDIHKSDEAYLAKAVSWYATGEDSIESLGRLMQDVVASFPEASNFMGSLYFNKGKFKTAEKVFAHAVQLDPSYVDARVNLLRSQFAQGKHVEVYGAGLSGLYSSTNVNYSPVQMERMLQQRRLKVVSIRPRRDLMEVVKELGV